MFQSLYDIFKCPICGNTTYPLLPVGSEFSVLTTLQIIGGGHRLERCSGCSSNDRDRLYYLYLRDVVKLFNGEPHCINLLHVAPEDCVAQKLMEVKGIDYLAIDSFEHGYDYPPYIHKMDLQHLDIPDMSVDLVICNHVLQDIKDDITAMKEIYRVLKPAGQAILQVPISPILNQILEYDGIVTKEQCTKAYGHRFHKRIYNEAGYISRLQSVGFCVNALSNSNPVEYSTNPKEKIFIAVKQSSNTLIHRCHET